MSPKPPRPTQAEREEMTRLLPAPAERDVPGRRHQLLKDHLMREIQHDTRTATARFPARRLRRLTFTAIPLAAGATALALATGGVLDHRPTAEPGPAVASGPSERGTDATPAAVLLDDIANVAASKATPAVRDDQYVFIASKVAYSGQSGSDSVARLDKPHLRQIWLSVDGTRAGLLRENGQDTELDTGREGVVVSEGDGRTTVRRPAGTDSERPVTVPGEATPSLNSPTYRYLESLPTDPGTLLKKIYDETKGAGPGPDQEAFVTIGDLLREQLAPPKVSAALYKAAAKIPGVTVVNDSVDAAGRRGIAVARVHDGERTEWIFDKHSLEFLGERSVMLKDTSRAKAGQITATTAVLNRLVTDKPGQTHPGAS
ncbi:CU044_5270 family protein [Streptomyces sp. NPDC087512]|uniref:CU044_5270 family protein n=1 Tax=Streptomyces sp. NPDC087512 TaxID=3155059 RepID=UPI00342ED8E3